jgi:CelD/BcsL family acetyltransferase involved in cellulose biosynthesis
MKKKASQDPASLFHDPLRVDFMVSAAQRLPHRFELFALERGADLAAALVTIREDRVRRFYTGWFDPELGKHSPCLSLMYEVTRQSLAAGLDCDYMTGEHPYKLRLANTSVPLYKLKAAPAQLAALSQAPHPALDLAG